MVALTGSSTLYLTENSYSLMRKKKMPWQSTSSSGMQEMFVLFTNVNKVQSSILIGENAAILSLM